MDRTHQNQIAIADVHHLLQHPISKVKNCLTRSIIAKSKIYQLQYSDKNVIMRNLRYKNLNAYNEV